MPRTGRKLRDRLNTTLILTTVLTTSLALFLIPYEDFVTDPLDIFTLPYQRSSIDLNPDIPLSRQLEGTRPLGQCREDMPENPRIAKATPTTENDGATETLYLFLLDVSGSTQSQGKILAPRWLPHAIERVNKYADREVFDVKKEVAVFELAKIRLADLLAGIGPEDTKPQPLGETFALWTMGTNPDPLFPAHGSREKEVSITWDNIKDSLGVLEGSTNNERNTDFVAAIRAFERNYPDYFSKKPDLAKDRVVVITILSDFIHDVDNKLTYRDQIERINKINEEWLALEEEIRHHSHGNVVANLIALTRNNRVEGLMDQPRPPTHKQIMGPYKKHFSPTKFSINAIAEDVQNHLLYPPMCCPEPIDFYYEGQRFISDLTLSIDVQDERKENYRSGLTIAIPKTVDNRDQPPVNLHWSLLAEVDSKTGKRPIEEVGWINTNGEMFSKDELKSNERVRLIVLDDPSVFG
ncbi:hypothetical protein [Candidatus Thiosymbion oneisti]|uniref:hypothetical protein n=1 Tax=Candidatus Thiosymbion oneisti TaxID=589554 RepID=UPI00105B4B2C|nr:hypothetical protein [Candidatus Thiosymbion oneisti]